MNQPLKFEYCKKCGEEIIQQCPKCQEHNHGYYSVPGVISIPKYDLPAYCHNCGKSYPWTQLRLDAANELAEEIDSLDDDEKEILKKSISELVKDGPKAKVAESRFKRLMVKAGSETYNVMKDILTDVVSETVKKTLFQ